MGQYLKLETSRGHLETFSRRRWYRDKPSEMPMPSKQMEKRRPAQRLGGREAEGENFLLSWKAHKESAPRKKEWSTALMSPRGQVREVTAAEARRVVTGGLTRQPGEAVESSSTGESEGRVDGKATEAEMQDFTQGQVKARGTSENHHAWPFSLIPVTSSRVR